MKPARFINQGRFLSVTVKTNRKSCAFHAGTWADTEPNAFYITFNKGEIYIPHQIQNKAMGMDRDLALILPEVLKT